MTPADRIVAAMEAKGLNRKQVALAVGVTPRTVRRWASGEMRPRNSHLLRLASVLDIPLEDLT